jgi:hypothetical protein
MLYQSDLYDGPTNRTFLQTGTNRTINDSDSDDNQQRRNRIRQSSKQQKAIRVLENKLERK